MDNNDKANTPQTYGYEEIHNPELKEIAENSQSVKETPAEEPVKETEAEPKETPEKEPEETTLDADELANDIANKLAEKNKPVEVEKTEEEEYQEWAAKFKEEHGKEASWTDVAKHLKEEAIKEIDNREAKKAQEAEQVRLQKAEQEKQSIEQFNKVVDEDLADLYAAEKLTPIKDRNNPSDQGVVERKELFSKMLEVNKERAEQGKRPIYSIKEIYYEHYKKPSAQPAGADAPISMGKGSTPIEGGEKDIDYAKDIKGKPWSFFKR